MAHNSKTKLVTLKSAYAERALVAAFDEAFTGNYDDEFFVRLENALHAWISANPTARETFERVGDEIRVVLDVDRITDELVQSVATWLVRELIPSGAGWHGTTRKFTFADVKPFIPSRKFFEERS